MVQKVLDHLPAGTLHDLQQCFVAFEKRSPDNSQANVFVVLRRHAGWHSSGKISADRDDRLGELRSRQLVSFPAQFPPSPIVADEDLVQCFFRRGFSAALAEEPSEP